jgi:ROK family
LPNQNANGGPRHGASLLPRVRVDRYNVEIRDDEGFVGDRANKRVFQRRLEEWRERLRGSGNDPLDSVPTSELYKDKRGLQEVLLAGEPEAAGLLIGAIEDYAQELAKVIHRLLEVDGWQPADRIAAGGGFREGRVGELAIGRASVLLKSTGRSVDLVPIHSDPDDAGLIGGIELVTADALSGREHFLAVDIGGTNFRAGIVSIEQSTDQERRRARVIAREVWRHADEQPTRDAAVRRLGDMLGRLRARAQQEGRDLAPYLSIACPGRIAADGTIEHGAQNLPGDWEAKDFNLPQALHEVLSQNRDWDLLTIIHNDAVVQGLSEVPFMRDIKHWGVLTIGTGLGNAHFTNR